MNETVRLSLPIVAHPLLYDHRIMGRPVLAAAHALGLMAAAVQGHTGLSGRHSRDATFESFLPLPEEPGQVAAFLEILEAGDGSFPVSLFTRIAAKRNAVTRLKPHLHVRFCPPPPRPPAPPLAIADVPAEPAFRVKSGPLYRELVPFGPAFRNLSGQVHLTPAGVSALIKAPVGVSHSITTPAGLSASIKAPAGVADVITGLSRDSVSITMPAGASASITAPAEGSTLVTAPALVRDAITAPAGVADATFAPPIGPTCPALGCPFVFDAALHAVNVWTQRYRGMVAFPVGYAQRYVAEPTQEGQEYLCRAVPRTASEGTQSFDIWILDRQDIVREEILGVQMRELFPGRLQPPAWIIEPRTRSQPRRKGRGGSSLPGGEP